MSGVSPPEVPFLWSRRSWSALPPASRLSPLGNVQRITLHHTVSAPAPPYREIRSLQEDHLRRGFSDIGYHFLLDRPEYSDGQDVYWGRETQPDGYLSLGAHAGGHNQGNIGVAVLGNYDLAPPSPAQLEALARLLSWLCFAYGVEPEAVVPHADLSPTACPGKHLLAALPALRWEVSWRLHGLPGSPPRAPLGGDQVRLLVGSRLLPLTAWWREGLVWAPVRAVATALGHQVAWDETARAVYLFLRRHPTLALPAPAPPQARLMVEDKLLPLDPPAYIQEGNTLAPLEPLARALGQKVLWHPPSLTAVVLPDP